MFRSVVPPPRATAHPPLPPPSVFPDVEGEPFGEGCSVIGSGEGASAGSGRGGGTGMGGSTGCDAGEGGRVVPDGGGEEDVAPGAQDRGSGPALISQPMSSSRARARVMSALLLWKGSRRSSG